MQRFRVGERVELIEEMDGLAPGSRGTVQRSDRYYDQISVTYVHPDSRMRSYHYWWVDPAYMKRVSVDLREAAVVAYIDRELGR